MAEQTQKLKVFVSYSRADIAFADQLVLALQERGFEPLIDRHDIDAAEKWKERLHALIFSCDTVVFVLSEKSAGSPICAWEVAEAAKLGKRMIPIVPAPIVGVEPPAALTDLNYIFFYPEPTIPGSGFYDGVQRLDRALRTDLAWLREATRLAEAAALWRAQGDAKDRLLRGQALREAETWAARAPRDQTVAADVSDFLVASRKADDAASRIEERNLRRIVTLLSLLGLVVLAGAGYAFDAARSANRQVSNVLADYSRKAGDEGDPYRALRFGVLGARTGLIRPADQDAQQALRRAAQSVEAETAIAVPESETAALAFFPGDDRRLLVVTDGAIEIWDAASGERLSKIERPEGFASARPIKGVKDRLLVNANNTEPYRGWAIWSAETGERLSEWFGLPYGRGDEPPSACDETLFIGTVNDGDEPSRFAIFDTATGAARLRDLSVNGEPVLLPQFSRDCSVIFTKPAATLKSEVGAALWRADDGALIHAFERPIQGFSFLKNRPDLVLTTAFETIGRREPIIELRSAETGERLAEMRSSPLVDREYLAEDPLRDEIEFANAHHLLVQIGDRLEVWREGEVLGPAASFDVAPGVLLSADFLLRDGELHVRTRHDRPRDTIGPAEQIFSIARNERVFKRDYALAPLEAGRPQIVEHSQQPVRAVREGARLFVEIDGETLKRNELFPPRGVVIEKIVGFSGGAGDWLVTSGFETQTETRKGETETTRWLQAAVWNWRTGEMVRTFGFLNGAETVTAPSASNDIVVGEGPDLIEVRDIRSGEVLLWRFKSDVDAHSVAPDPLGRIAFLTKDKRRIDVFNLSGSDEFEELDPANEPIVASIVDDAIVTRGGITTTEFARVPGAGDRRDWRLFSPAGERDLIVGAFNDASGVSAYDARTGEPLGEAKIPGGLEEIVRANRSDPETVFDVVPGDEGVLHLMGRRLDVVEIWDPDTGDLRAARSAEQGFAGYKTAPKGAPWAVSWSDDFSLVQVWNTATDEPGALIKPRSDLKSATVTLLEADGGRVLVTGSTAETHPDRFSELFDARSGQKIADPSVSDIKRVLGESGAWLLATNNRTADYLIETATGRRLQSWTRDDAPDAILDQGSQIVLASVLGGRDGALLGAIWRHGDRASETVWTLTATEPTEGFDGREADRVRAAFADGEVVLQGVSSTPPWQGDSAAFSNDGSALFAGGQVRVNRGGLDIAKVGALDPDTGATLWSRYLLGDFQGLRLVAGGAVHMTFDDRIVILSQADGQEVATIPLLGDYGYVDYAGDPADPETMLVSTSLSQREPLTIVYEAATGVEQVRIEGSRPTIVSNVPPRFVLGETLYDGATGSVIAEVGDLLAYGGRAGLVLPRDAKTRAVAVVDLATGRTFPPVSLQGDRHIRREHFVVRKDGRRALVTSTDRSSVWLLDGDTGAPIRKIEIPGALASAPYFDDVDGTIVVRRRGPARHAFWTPVGGGEPVIVTPQEGRTEWTLSEDGSRLAAYRHGGSDLEVFSTRDGQSLGVYEGQPILNARFGDAEGAHLAILRRLDDGRRTIDVRRVSDGAIIGGVIPTASKPKNLDFVSDRFALSADGRRIVYTASEGSRFMLLDATSGRELARGPINRTAPISPVFVGPDSETLVTMTTRLDEWLIQFWETSTGAFRSEYRYPRDKSRDPKEYTAPGEGRSDQFLISPGDEARLLLHDGHGYLRLIDTATGRLLVERQIVRQNPVVSFDPRDPSQVLIKSDNGQRIEVWGTIWSQSWPSNNALVDKVCRSKLSPSLRTVTIDDVAFAPILRGRVSEDVCSAPVSSLVEAPKQWSEMLFGALRRTSKPTERVETE